MRFLIVLILVALLALPAAAQVDVPLPDDIIAVSDIEFIVAAGAISFGAVTVKGAIRQPAGIFVWAKGPFRYMATFPAYADTKDSNTKWAAADTLVDTPNGATRGGKGAVEYPVLLHLPGATSVTATVPADTLWARAYYTKD